jgi:phosphoglycolate phosphatase
VGARVASFARPGGKTSLNCEPMRELTLAFDLDGTLVDTAPDLLAATNHVLEHVGLPPVDRQTLRPHIGFGARRMIESSTVGAGLTAAQHEELLERFLDYYGAHISDGSRPFDGAVEALETFKAAGAKLAVCTNKREDMSRQLLDALDLTRFFDAIAGRDTLAESKPHPGHLLGAIRMAGGDAGRAVMVGDSRVDIATAKAAHVPVVAVRFGYSDGPIASYEPDAIIDHYSELGAAIEALKR